MRGKRKVRGGEGIRDEGKERVHIRDNRRMRERERCRLGKKGSREKRG